MIFFRKIAKGDEKGGGPLASFVTLSAFEPTGGGNQTLSSRGDAENAEKDQSKSKPDQNLVEFGENHLLFV
ncbi:MAG: hypothetical protein JXB25_00990, partial [Deltaproteobacteria bacterium]|nr:hypothetical protein [Deltaproteobacteria bacterium]